MSQSKENEEPESNLKRDASTAELPLEADSIQPVKKLKLDEKPAVEEVSDEDEESVVVAGDTTVAVLPTDEVSKLDPPIDNTDSERCPVVQTEEKPSDIQADSSPPQVSAEDPISKEPYRDDASQAGTEAPPQEVQPILSEVPEDQAKEPVEDSAEPRESAVLNEAN